MNGLKAILARPWAYRLFTKVVGAGRCRARYVRDFIRPWPGARILDIGCGPADILAWLHGVQYVGVDISPEYIRAAKERFDTKGEFICRSVNEYVVEQPHSFDLVLATGLLHHLDDTEADTLLEIARQALKPNGRFISFDGCFSPGQSWIARWMLQNDRGQFVRSREEYLRLARKQFPRVESHLHHRLLNIPYTHLIMNCSTA